MSYACAPILVGVASPVLEILLLPNLANLATFNFHHYILLIIINDMAMLYHDYTTCTHP